MNGESDFNEEAGSFLRIDLQDGTWLALGMHEESVVKKAIRDFRERRIDSLIEVEHRTGYTIGIAASCILYYQPCTPETRATAILEEIRQDEWEDRYRREHAVKPWDG